MRGYFYHATVQRIKKDYGVKKGMVITEDQQGMKYVPCADFTMHYKGEEIPVDKAGYAVIGDLH